MLDKVTLPRIVGAKEKLTMLTAYDFWTAQLVDQAGADMILVGDSLGMVIQGKQDTLSVSVDEMVYHCKAVKRGSQRCFVVGDMPYLSYHINRDETVRNAGRLVSEGAVDAVKLEGGGKRIPMIEAILDAEIPVMGHLGLTPQSVNALGGFKVQAKAQDDRLKLIDEALALQSAGIFALVLECIPYDLAQEVTEMLSIPTIGIGAGPHCSGQVLVTHDMLGMSFGRTPKFVRQFANLSQSGADAVGAFCQAVKNGDFPSLKESFRPAKKRKADQSQTIQLYGGEQASFPHVVGES